MIIERVERLTGLDHHVIRHINDIVDAADPDLFQCQPKPVRARADLQVADNAGDVARA